MAERKTVPVPIRRVHAGASGGMAVSSARSQKELSVGGLSFIEQASPLYSHKGRLSGETPDTPVLDSRRSEIYSQSKCQNPVMAEQSRGQESARKSKSQPPVCCRLSAASYQRCCTKRSSAPGLLHDDAGAALHREQPQPNRYESPCVECH